MSPCVYLGCSPQRWCVWLRGTASQRKPSSGRTIGPGDERSPPSQRNKKGEGQKQVLFKPSFKQNVNMLLVILKKN